ADLDQGAAADVEEEALPVHTGDQVQVHGGADVHVALEVEAVPQQRQREAAGAAQGLVDGDVVDRLVAVVRDGDVARDGVEVVEQLPDGLGIGDGGADRHEVEAARPFAEEPLEQGPAGGTAAGVTLDRAGVGVGDRVRGRLVAVEHAADVVHDGQGSGAE